MFGGKRSGSMDRGGGPRSRSSERTRPGSAERQSHVRTARSSVIDVPVQRAPDFRADKNKNIAEVIQFIQEWGIDHPEQYTVKTLQCPSSKVFLEIFKFIMGMFMPGHVLPARHEDEIPFILKSLGYPYNINRSSVLSIAPHSWPLLCHSLVWVTRAITDMSQLSIDTPHFVTFASAVFLNPSADCEDQMRSSQLDDVKDTIRELKQLLITRQKALHDIENSETGNPDELQERIYALERNVSKLEEYLKNTKDYLMPKENLLVELRATQQSLSAILAEKTQRKNQLEDQFNIRAEELSLDEREEMKRRQAVFISQSRQLTTDIEEVEQKNWDIEIKLAQGLKDLEDLCRKFNMSAAQSVDDLQLKATECVTDQVSQIVQPYLTEINNRIYTDEELKQKQHIRDQLNSALNEERRELDSLQAALTKTQEANNLRISQLNALYQESKRSNKESDERVRLESIQRDELIKRESQLKKDLSDAEQRIEDLKTYHADEEKRRIVELQQARDEFVNRQRWERETLEKQVHELTMQNAQLAELKYAALRTKLQAAALHYMDN